MSEEMKFVRFQKPNNYRDFLISDDYLHWLKDYNQNEVCISVLLPLSVDGEHYHLFPVINGFTSEEYVEMAKYRMTILKGLLEQTEKALGGLLEDGITYSIEYDYCDLVLFVSSVDGYHKYRFEYLDLHRGELVSKYLKKRELISKEENTEQYGLYDFLEQGVSDSIVLKIQQFMIDGK